MPYWVIPMLNEGYCCNGLSLHTSETLRRVRVDCTYILYYNNLTKKHSKVWKLLWSHLISSSAAYFYADISFCYHINIDGTLNLKRKHLSVQFRITYHGFLFLLKKQQSALLMSMIKHLYILVIIGLHFFNMFSLSLFFTLSRDVNERITCVEPFV